MTQSDSTWVRSKVVFSVKLRLRGENELRCRETIKHKP